MIGNETLILGFSGLLVSLVTLGLVPYLIARLSKKNTLEHDSTGLKLDTRVKELKGHFDARHETLESRIEKIDTKVDHMTDSLHNFMLKFIKEK